MRISVVIMAAVLWVMPTAWMVDWSWADAIGQIKTESKEVVHEVKDGAVEIGKKAVGTGKDIKKGSQKAWTEIKKGAKEVGHEIKDAYKETKASVSNTLSGQRQGDESRKKPEQDRQP